MGLLHALESDNDDASLRCLPFERGDLAGADDEAASKRLERRRNARTIRLQTLWIAHLELGDIERRPLACRGRLGMEALDCYRANDDTREYCEHHCILCLYKVSSLIRTDAVEPTPCVTGI